MKNINTFEHKKYANPKYEKIEEGIYQSQDEYGKMQYHIAITFEQEPEFEEGDTSAYISQYPIEDVLEKFYVYVSDFFDELNDGKSNVCFYELSSNNLQDVANVKKSIVGKHVYNQEQDGYVKLIIE